jgi:hypothetical protein
MHEQGKQGQGSGHHSGQEPDTGREAPAGKPPAHDGSHQDGKGRGDPPSPAADPVNPPRDPDYTRKY